MNILFVHRNFPAQFVHAARELARDPRNKVAAIGSRTARTVPGVLLRKYSSSAPDVAATHPFARRFDVEAHRAEQVIYALTSLKASGFVPDVILAHPGWGETLPLRTVFPDAKIIIYCEFYYGNRGRDVGFDPEFPETGLDGHVALHAKNAATLLALAECDSGLSPTMWQRSTYPEKLQSEIEIIHEGVDTSRVRPNPSARLALPGGPTLSAGDEIVTFVSRNLEPQRGYHVFMRALPRILAERPRAQVVIVGGDGVSYGAPAPAGRTWKDVFLAEVADRIDRSRVHFAGRLPYDRYLEVLQVSAAHVYLTYPFVLSWSLVEAMSAGCLVIGSDTAPVRDAVDDGRTGLLVPFFDVDRLSRQVVAALARPESVRHLRAAARRTAVERFDLHGQCLPTLMRMIEAYRPECFSLPQPGTLPPAA